MRKMIRAPMIHAACELVGRVDAARGLCPTTNPAIIAEHVCSALHAMFKHNSIQQAWSFEFPTTGQGSLLSDWERWYREGFDQQQKSDGPRSKPASRPPSNPPRGANDV